jgi:hypothetical protein
VIVVVLLFIVFAAFPLVELTAYLAGPNSFGQRACYNRAAAACLIIF